MEEMMLKNIQNDMQIYTELRELAKRADKSLTEWPSKARDEVNLEGNLPEFENSLTIELSHALASNPHDRMSTVEPLLEMLRQIMKDQIIIRIFANQEYVSVAPAVGDREIPTRSRESKI